MRSSICAAIDTHQLLVRNDFLRTSSGPERAGAANVRPKTCSCGPGRTRRPGVSEITSNGPELEGGVRTCGWAGSRAWAGRWAGGQARARTGRWVGGQVRARAGRWAGGQARARAGRRTGTRICERARPVHPHRPPTTHARFPRPPPTSIFQAHHPRPSSKPTTLPVFQALSPTPVLQAQPHARLPNLPPRLV